jgi:hypothetical protein
LVTPSGITVRLTSAYGTRAGAEQAIDRLGFIAIAAPPPVATLQRGNTTPR